MTPTHRKTLNLPGKVAGLLKKGVRMTNPFSVEIGDEVNPQRIAGSLTIYGAARLCGENLLIAENVRLGEEAPVTVVNCQLGRAVELKGGYFVDSVFLDNVSIGSNAQIRRGCLLEEESGGNHTVGLKQTILFPFVTLGSLINFCDCLMAGGTSRRDHSEVGSSYVHFNFTPRQDKAAASLIGDVSRGVMLREKPVFLGGQGGIVGPLFIDYGTIIPAGVVCRRKVPDARSRNNRRAALREKFFLNVFYVANLLALRQWYIHVRRGFFYERNYGEGLYAGAIKVLEESVLERLQQMEKFVEKIDEAAKKKKDPGLLGVQKEIVGKWPQVEAYLMKAGNENIGGKDKETFLKIIQSKIVAGNSYLETIKSLMPAEAAKGTNWLNKIVHTVVAECSPATDKKRRISTKGFSR